MEGRMKVTSANWNTSMTYSRLLAMVDFPDEKPRTRRLAERICEAAFGDWGAAGYEVKLACVRAAQTALLTLDQHGFDITFLDYEEENAE